MAIYVDLSNVLLSWAKGLVSISVSDRNLLCWCVSDNLVSNSNRKASISYATFHFISNIQHLVGLNNVPRGIFRFTPNNLSFIRHVKNTYKFTHNLIIDEDMGIAIFHIEIAYFTCKSR